MTPTQIDRIERPSRLKAEGSVRSWFLFTGTSAPSIFGVSVFYGLVPLSVHSWNPMIWLGA